MSELNKKEGKMKKKLKHKRSPGISYDIACGITRFANAETTTTLSTTNCSACLNAITDSNLHKLEVTIQDIECQLTSLRTTIEVLKLIPKRTK